MKSKWIKRLAILFTFAFLFIGTGCSSNPYDGQFCGNAEDPNTEFGKIRYTYIIDYLADEHEIQDQFIMQNGDLVKVDENGQYYLYFMQIIMVKIQMKFKLLIIKMQ